MEASKKLEFSKGCQLEKNWKDVVRKSSRGRVLSENSERNWLAEITKELPQGKMRKEIAKKK